MRSLHRHVLIAGTFVTLLAACATTAPPPGTPTVARWTPPPVWSKVEAYEDVVTPAGRFKAFKITHANDAVQFTNWWSPELALVVKSKAERKSSFHAGAGVRETELVSLDLRK